MDVSQTDRQKDRQMDNIPDGNSDEENEALDPRIQTELDHLNVASAEINRMENELDEARSKYRSIISETSNRMEVILHDRKRSIQKAREYYKLMGEAKIAQAEALKAARQFQTATTVYKAAKETVALAECRLIEETEASAAQLTSAWQEMLNHAISKVTVAEREKTKSEQEHRKRAAKFAELESRIQVLEKKFSRSIKKSRPYFELKAELDIKLMQQKQNVNDLQAAIKSNKRKYTDTLRKLEKISEEIHQSRHDKFWSKVPRMPGVGAETDSVASSLSELGKESFGYESDLESQFDSESLNKSDLDLRLSLELGGTVLTLDNDKTPVDDLEGNFIDDKDDVFEPEDTSEKANNTNNGHTDIPESSIGAHSNNIIKSIDTDSKNMANLKDSELFVASNPSTSVSKPGEAKVLESNINIGKDTGAAKNDIDNAIDQTHKDDSDGEFTESFESAHEEQAISPAEGFISTLDKHSTETKPLEKKQISGDSTSAFVDVDINEGENVTKITNRDMTTVERPSLSGAED